MAVRTRRLGAAAAFATGLLLLVVIGAVGLIGVEGDPFDRIYFGVIATALVGSALARFRSRGTAYALFAAAFAQILVAWYGLMIGKHLVPVSSIPEILISNHVFAGFWAGSGWLFRRAALEEE